MGTGIKRRVVLGLDEVMGVVDGVMAEHCDPVVICVMDTDHIAIAMLEEYCYGHTNIDVESTFTNLQIPRDVRTQILDETRHRLYNHIQTAFRYVYPSRTYSFRNLGRSIVLEESVEEYTDAKTIDQPQDPTGEEDAWVPERMRRRT